MIKFIFISVLFILHHSVHTQSIHRVACQGDVSKLDSMLLHNDINVRDDRGRSLLHWAVACKKKEVFDYLVRNNIKINQLDIQGKTAMHVAVQYDNVEFLEYLISLQTNRNWHAVYGPSLMERATLNKSEEVIQNLILSGVDLNATNARGSTALEISTRLNAEHFSKFLIGKGADQNMIRKVIMKGRYLDPEEPKLKPKLFAPNFISTEEYEFGSIFNKDRTAFYFGVDIGSRNEIRFSTKTSGGWTKPNTLISHEEGKLVPILDDNEFSLEQANEAHAHLESKTAIGKVVIEHF